MKRYEFDIPEAYLSKFFRAIRIKSDVIEVLMETLNYIILNPSIPSRTSKGKIVLLVDKMSRLFFFTEGKYFSIVAPFMIKEVSTVLEFSFDSFIIDVGLTSKVISLLKSDNFISSCSLDFVEQIYDYDVTCDESFWLFFKQLLMMEDGYIRYDIDEPTYLEHKAKGQEHRHPLNHYDLFYSSNSTFKIGLESAIDATGFIDLLNTNTDCKYLKR